MFINERWMIEINIDISAVKSSDKYIISDNINFLKNDV